MTQTEAIDIIEVVCVEACPKTDNSNVYICMDDYQDDADLSPAFGVAFMGSGYCMMELASQDSKCSART